MGAILDLPSPEWFGDFNTRTTVHVIDSARPQNLSSLFGAGENGDRIVVWDDGGAEKLDEERKAWEALMFEPEPDSDEEDDSEDEPEFDEDEDQEDDYEESGSPSGKRRSLGDGDRKGKRRKVDEDVSVTTFSPYSNADTLQRPQRMSRDERDAHSSRLEKHYMAGTWYGQSAAGTIYILATVLERVDNELLW